MLQAKGFREKSVYEKRRWLKKNLKKTSKKIWRNEIKILTFALPTETIRTLEKGF
jgi:hypothetical protein